ncbi:MAG: hypothetical protein HQ568_03630 [Calditrichaeota bacterium]|nr:hypothetical protein [Calditrichota bacterium]
MLKNTLTFILVIILGLFFAVEGFSIGLENLSTFEVAGGLTIPAGNLAEENDLNSGFGLNLSYLTSNGNKIFKLSGDFLMSKWGGELILFEFPVSFSVIFPIAPESASSPYFGIGPAFMLHTEDFDDGVTSYSMAKGHAGVNALAGIMFAPQHWRSTFIDVYVKYSRYFNSRHADDSTIDLFVGFGFSI